MNKEIQIKNAQLKIYQNGLKFEILEYNGYTKSKSRFMHLCGYEFEMRFDHLIDRKKCPRCHGVWRDKEMFQEESNKVHNSEYEIIEFKNGNFPVKIKHKICGKEFFQIGHRHLRGDRCYSCYGCQKLSREEIIKISSEKWNNEYEILSEEINYNKKSKIKHKICGYEYDQVVSSHLIGFGCPECAGNARLTKESTQEKSNILHNNEYLILSNPNGAKSKIGIKHILCGKEFTQTPSDHLSGGGCPFCNYSRGEKYIEGLLISKNIKFESQKTFDGCKFKNKLKFDFFIPENNLCIEFDGQQHFNPIRYFGGVKAFNLQKIKDKIKNEYCLYNNIKLIRFKYDTDFADIENKLKELIYTL